MSDTPGPLPASAPTARALVDALLQQYACLRDLAREALERDVTQAAQALQVPPGTLLFHEGQPCAGFPFVLEGEVRVARASASGRTLELYRVTPGEVCLVSASCLFGEARLSARGEATLPTRLLVLAPAAFERWTAHAPFRRHVFGVFADRMADLMTLVEAVAFQRLDQRLAAALLGHGEALHVTHQQLADELGTVREIVTRLLRRFEREGSVQLARERIRILDAAALRRAAQHG